MERRESRLENRKGGVDEEQVQWMEGRQEESRGALHVDQVQWRGGEADWRIEEVECSGRRKR